MSQTPQSPSPPVTPRTVVSEPEFVSAPIELEPPEPEHSAPSIAHPPADYFEPEPEPIPLEEAPTEEVFNSSDEEFVEELINSDGENDSLPELEPDSDAEEEPYMEETLAENEEEKTSTENKHESYECGICYETLTMDTNVVTKCDHHYCKKCFYRWIETNATCPLCRDPINCNVNLTPEQLNTATSQEYGMYIHFLERNNTIQRRQIKLMKEYTQVKMGVDQLLRSQVRLREQMDMTRAATDGLIAAREWVLNKSEAATKNPHKGSIWMADSWASYFHEEMERINNLNFNPEIVSFANDLKRKRKPRRNIVIKKRAKRKAVPMFVFTAGESKNKTDNTSNSDEPEEDNNSAAAAEPSENESEVSAEVSAEVYVSIM